ncbi:MAG: DUF1929 domain-containing protein [Gammaproteobacteria bacterium]|nr:DUF1929 domain-containing protein [Gammaproteobacteria bacterium]
MLVFTLFVTAAAQAQFSSVSQIEIRNAGTQYLQVAEVIAISSATGRDVALSSTGATASSSGTWQNNTGPTYIPANAIDGNNNPGANGFYYHSASTSGSFLRIDLPAPITLDEVILVGRSDCCSDRDIYDLTLRSSNGNVIAEFSGLNANNSQHRVSTNSGTTRNVANDGQWGSVLSWPLVAVSMANLPDGRVLTYSGSERRTWPTTERTFSATWDPDTGQFSETLHQGHNMFCGTMSMMPDGEVFVAGGRNRSNSPWTSIYDYNTDNWTQIQNMASGGRWYPTTLALGDGSIMSAMGIATNVPNPDLWSPDTGWRILNGIDFQTMRTRRALTNVFPLLSLAPSGQIFHFWDTVENHYIDPNGNGSSTRSNANTDDSEHAGGIQVMYDEGKLLISGNNDGSWGNDSSAVTDNAFTVDLNGATPVLRATSSMNYRRKFHQLIPLPTGEVLAVGGNTTGRKFCDCGSILEPEIWNPATGNWRTAAPMSVPRDYHSTALLLTDGRILTAGGGYQPSNSGASSTHQDAQIYSPAYLFSATGQLANRPTVVAEFDEIGNGQGFTVNTTGNISYFSMIKMSATTHGINTDVRFLKPQFSQSGSNRYDLEIHANRNVATPGYWMLFAVDTAGVPSVAEVIKVTTEPTDPNNGNPPIVDEIVSTPVAAGQNSPFSATAAGVGLTYRWNFGDGTGDSPWSSNNEISHTYAQPGRYIVTVTVRTPGGIETVETFTQVVFGSATSNKPVQSGGIAEVVSRDEVWVVNPDNNSVGIVNNNSLVRTAMVNVGINPRALAVAPDGRVWVVNKDTATVSIINPNTRSIVQTLQLDTGSRPHGIVFNSHSAYIALEGIATVVQLNAQSGAERRRAFAGEFARHLSLRGAGDRLYVSSFITPHLPGENGANPSVSGRGGQVRVFSTNSNSLSPIRTILLSHINRAISEHSGPGLPNYLGPVAISPDGLSAWVPSKQDNILGGSLRSGFPLTFDQSVRAITSRINLSNEQELLNARVDHDNASVASHSVFGPYGLTLFTSLEGNRQIALIDAMTNAEYARFDVGHAPQSLALSESGDRLYVHNFMDRTLGIYDVSDVVRQGATTVTELAEIRVANGERLAANVFRGKQLFYDARDDRLAALNYMSCASCHNEGGHDGRTWDFTHLGEGVRNTISLNGTAGTGHGLMHWSANFDEVQDFEGQIRSFAGGSGLMSNAQFLAGTRSSPLGDPKAGLSSDLDALAAYVSSLDEFPVSPYRDSDGTLSADAEAGRALFNSEGCATCHSGDRLTDSTDTPDLHNIGTLTGASGDRLDGNLAGIDTPTLLGAWHTAPYLHNGSASTIADAIAAHSSVNLSSGDLGRLSEFVLQLNADDVGEPTCREPSIDPASEGGVFVWQECDGPWNLMLTGVENAGTVASKGTISSDSTLSDVTDVSLESRDTLVSPNANLISFDLLTSHPWNDAFTFAAANTDSLCVNISSLSSVLEVYVGPDKTPVSGAFNPATLASCTPPQSDCEAPSFDAASERALFSWIDCSGDLHLVGTGAAAGANYAGHVYSDTDFVDVRSRSIESSDTLRQESGNSALFDIRMGGPWIDEIIITPASDANLCVAVGIQSAGTALFAGQNKTVVQSPFNPATFESCTPPNNGDCGNPLVNSSTEEGFFMWKECDGTWSVMITGTLTGSARYSGSITSTEGFNAITSISVESSDALTTNLAAPLDFNLTTANPWDDRFTFEVDESAELCVTLDSMPASLGRYVGPDRASVGLSFNPETLGACN